MSQSEHAVHAREVLKKHLQSNTSISNKLLLSKYEEARVVAVRAQQLSLGAVPHIKVPDSIHDTLVIAEMELKAGCLRQNLRRFLPSGPDTDVVVDELIRADALFSQAPANVTTKALHSTPTTPAASTASTSPAASTPTSPTSPTSPTASSTLTAS